MFFKIQLFFILNICSPFNSINIFSVVHSPFPKWEMIGSCFMKTCVVCAQKHWLKNKQTNKQEKCFSNQYDLILLNQRPSINKPNASVWLIRKNNCHFIKTSKLFGKDSDAGRDWGQEEKGTTEDEMAGWHHWLGGRESEWTPGVGDGQGGLACCDSWGHKESDTTERLNWTETSKQLQ